MEYIRGDLFTRENVSAYDYVCFTSNSMLNKKGELVMGKGVALCAKNYRSDLPSKFGDIIESRGLEGRFYGLLAYKNFIAFQTKIHWKDDSYLEDVQRSVELLKRLALKHPNKTFALPFPAVVNDHQKRMDIKPLLDTLPDNIFIFYNDTHLTEYFKSVNI